MKTMDISTLAYVDKQSKAASIHLNLPTDFPRSSAQSFQRETRSFSLSRALTAELVTLGQRMDVNLHILLLTAFKILIYRYTNQEDIVVAQLIPSGNKKITGDSNDIFQNVILLSTELAGQLTYRELVEHVREVLSDVQTYWNLPLGELVKKFPVKFPPSESITLQVLFGFQGLSNKSPDYDYVYSLSRSCELTLFVEEGYENLTGFIAYNSSLYESSTIDRFIGHFETLLASIVAQPEKPILSLPILTTREQYQLLVEWNKTDTSYPNGLHIMQSFEVQVEKTPNAIAVIDGDRKLTYGDLNRRSNKLARYLRIQGLKADVPVGICMERSLEMVIGLLGILKAGGAYIPLDPNYPADRLAIMIKDAAPPLLITQAKFIEKLRHLESQIIALDSQWRIISDEGMENLGNQVSSENLAYVIFTSGSTGKPKGVIIPHRAISNHMFWLQSEFHIDQSDRILQKTPFSFDAAVWEFYAPLLTGGQLVMATPGGHRDSHYLIQTIIRYGITILQVVPTQLQMLLDNPDVIQCTSLRIVFCGGEQLPARLITLFFEKLPAAKLYNLYGPSEATIDTTVWQCKPLIPQAPVLIGRPIANVQTYILDRTMQPVPIGIAGELYIGGAGVGSGYLNRPELTTEKFLQNPFKDDPEARLYKTGDMVRYRADGNIEFLGRIDDQVKIRGFRIELGEVEVALQEHPSVRKVVVSACEDVLGNKQLIAYIVLEKNNPPTQSEWRQFLSHKLPEYMIPSAFIFLEELPLQPNGKVDRTSLPKPELRRSVIGSEVVQPRTVVEQILVDIWTKTLAIEQVSVYDNYFDLGGDSIRSIQISALANQSGLQLTSGQVLQHQTIADLAAVVSTTGPVVRSEQGPVTGVLPLTPIQKRFFEQELTEPGRLSQTFVLELTRIVDTRLLEKAVQHLLLHHDALRLRYTWDGRNWHQNLAAPDGASPFLIMKLSGLKTIDEQMAALHSTVLEQQNSLRLEEGPLIRAALVDFGSFAPSYLVLVIHTLLVDSISWRILLEHLELIYEHLSQSRPVQLPPKTTSFKYWAHQLSEYVETNTLRKELPFWLSMHAIHAAHLPVEFLSESTPQSERDSVSISLSAEDTRAFMTETSHAYRTLVTDLLIAALADAFSRWTGRNSLQVDLEGHGRETIFPDVDLSLTLGNFSAVYPVLLDVEMSSEPGERLVTVKEQLRKVPHGGVGYGVLRYLSTTQTVNQTIEALPQSKVLFQYLGQLDRLLGRASFFRPVEDFPYPQRDLLGNRHYRMEITAGIVQGRLLIVFSYNTNTFRRSTVENLASGYQDALLMLIAHCKSMNAGRYTPSDFPEANLSQQELDDLLHEINELDG
ncbi:MAG TPA: amino acid adenylation domain-containing protein [Anaerolineales bacterium]|nr:amino acid adenylation domain-containing protein [Anaerolineales bacterium]